MRERLAILREQLDYYRARAAEYDQWWLRQGRYDRGAQLNAAWFADAATLRSALDTFRPAGRILELACGTGIWTEQLVPYADSLTAVDASSEMLALNAGRVRSSLVEYIQADLFQWKPSPLHSWDTVFFAFWLSHVPPERFAAFWDMVGTCLAPGGRVFFIDSQYQETSTAVDHRLPDRNATVLRRRLNDGREYRIYKIFYQPDELTERLSRLGWSLTVEQTEHYFLFGYGSLKADR